MATTTNNNNNNTTKSANDRHWDHMFWCLVQHKVVSDSDDDTTDPELAVWVWYQRCLHKNKCLRTDQRRRLDSMKFEWKANLKTNQLKFEWMLSKLNAYKGRFGHVKVPTRWPEDPTLGKWVSRQRDTQLALSEAKRKRLDDLGFVWYIGYDERDNTKHKTKDWLQQYQKVKAFHAVHGHCKIPFGLLEDDSLPQWILSQQSLSRKGTLVLLRKRSLQAIGVVFDTPTISININSSATNANSRVAAKATPPPKQRFGAGRYKRNLAVEAPKPEATSVKRRKLPIAASVVDDTSRGKAGAPRTRLAAGNDQEKQSSLTSQDASASINNHDANKSMMMHSLDTIQRLRAKAAVRTAVTMGSASQAMLQQYDKQHQQGISPSYSELLVSPSVTTDTNNQQQQQQQQPLISNPKMTPALLQLQHLQEENLRLRQRVQQKDLFIVHLETTRRQNKACIQKLEALEQAVFSGRG